MHEMKRFLACILNMVIIKKPTICTILVHSLVPSHPMICENVYQASLFLLVNKGLPGPEEPDSDPCARYQPLVDHANRVFRHHYTPHHEISVDESLVSTKYKTSLMQYSLNKHHHHWGIQFWMFCDPVSNYCLGVFTYREARSQEDKNI
jgi:hypothetical protein